MRQRRRVSLNAGEELEVATPLGVVRIEAGTGDVLGDDVIDIQPKPTSHRLDGHVLLTNVQNRQHSVRLVAFALPLAAATAMPELVRQEREDLVRRVLEALGLVEYAAFPEGSEPFGEMVQGDKARLVEPEMVAAVAAKVAW